MFLYILDCLNFFLLIHVYVLSFFNVPWCSQLFLVVPLCSRVFQGVPGLFHGVPGCSGVFHCSSVLGVPAFSTCHSRVLL